MTEVQSLATSYATEGMEAVTRLTGLLLASKDEWWNKRAYRLMYWSKTHDDASLLNEMRMIGIRASEELANPATAANHARHANRAGLFLRRPRLAGNLILAGCALPLVLTGTKLSMALAWGWTPLYRPDRMTPSQGFHQLIALAERNPGLGIDREILSAARSGIHRLGSLQEREKWAETNQTRIQTVVQGWRTDPGAALLMAEIIGWTGNVESTLRYYHHAITCQGKNESLFMARSFTGQYLYELSISAGASGQNDEQRHFATQAARCFQEAAEAMGERKLHPSFQQMLLKCRNVIGPGT